MPSKISYLSLNPDCSLKLLEIPHLYHRRTDELYEINDETQVFITRCIRSEVRSDEPGLDPEIISYCLEEGLLIETTCPQPRVQVMHQAPNPSLRYLEVQLTDRCNLRCAHCYLGEPKGSDLPLETASHLLAQFEEIQGLRLLLSGGEPLLYPYFWEINEQLPRYDIRAVLLSNGTLINREVAKRLRVHEVQISLDGMELAHDHLRGRGNFRSALTAIANLRDAGIEVSIGTMVNRINIADFDQLRELVKEQGICEWNIDLPANCGRLEENQNLQLPPSEAAAILDYAAGGGHHLSGEGYACGAHLAAVIPSGHLVKCGFYGEEVGILVQETGLRQAWEKLPKVKLSQLNCHCTYVHDCRGGCRYRAQLAGDIWGPDPVQCFRFGVRNSL